MTPQDFLLMVFCTIDDELKTLTGSAPLRSRGPRRTKLADSEVITIEIVGEFWGLADDVALLRFFRRYHAAEFPALARVHRTTFARQAANTCWIKRTIQRRVAGRLADPAAPWLVDSLPLPACRFRRAQRSHRFHDAVGWGFDPVAQKAFYGFRLHLRTSPDGVILAYQLAPAQAAETEVFWELVPDPPGTALGDRNSWSPTLQAEFEAAGGRLWAPYKLARHDPDRARSGALQAVRRRIEDTIGQLVERYCCRRIKVKDLWHLEHRLVRKILSLTVAVWMNVVDGHQPLQLERLAA
jgi:Transposase DDE domain